MPGWISTSRSSIILIPLVLFSAGLALRIGVAAYERFDGLYGQDAFAYYDYSITLLNHLKDAHLPPPFYWPIGYPLLVAATFWVFGVSPLAAQAVSVMTGAAVAPLMFWLVRELYLLEGQSAHGAESAVAAGLACAFSGALLQSSLVVMSDVAALFWVTLAALSLVRYLRTGNRRWLAAAAFTAAWAVATRYISALLLVPLGGLYIYQMRAPCKVTSRKRLRGDLVTAGVMFMLVLLPLMAIGFQTPETHYGTQASRAGQILSQWSWRHIFAREITTPADGHFRFRLPHALFYLTPVAHPFFLSPLLTPALLWGAWWLIRQRRWPLIVFLAPWLVGLYVFLVGFPTQNSRYTLSFLPAMSVLVGIGTGEGTHRFSHKRRRVLLGYFIVALASMLVWNLRAMHGFIEKKNRDLDVVHWLESRLPHEAAVFTFGLTLTLDYYSSFQVIELYNTTPAFTHQAIERSEGAFAVVDVESLQRQWRGLPPETHYQWLRRRYQLRPLAQVHRYTIFQISSP